MKNKTILFLLSFIAGFSAQLEAQEKGFTITGQFKGLPDGTKMYLRTQEKDTVGRAISKGDKFSFTGKLPLNGRFHFIILDTLISKVGTRPLFLTNEKITISGVVGNKEITVEGSSNHNDYQHILNEVGRFENIRKGISKELDLFSMQQNNVDTLQRNLAKQKFNESWKKYEEAIKAQNKAGVKWIYKHLNSLYTPFAIIGHKDYIGVDSMEHIYSMLDNAVKASYYGVELRKVIYNSKFSTKIQEGKIIPNFEIYEINGESTKIHDLAAKGKLTLIDFWASWCSPCRAAIPRLKEIYQLYKDKGFNIIGVSIDKNEGDWKKAMSEEKTPWTNGLDKYKVSSSLFDMKAIPAYILIDGNGKLLAFDCGVSSIPSFGGSLDGEALNKKLNELLNKGGK